MAATARNADPVELAKFSALAQSWWDPNGPSKPLHDVNPLRLQYVKRFGDLAHNPSYVRAFSDALSALWARGVRSTLADYLSDKS